MQMLNFPVQNGTSGHLIGAVLGVGLLGIPFAILSMAIVLIVQALFFGDGGVNALGANVLNMAIIGAGLLGIAYNSLKDKGVNDKIALGVAAFLSVLAGAFACSVEVAASGGVSFSKVLPAMMSVHALIGIGEGLLTVGVVYALNAYCSKKQNESNFALGASILATGAALVSPLASGFPDGLEWVAQKLSFIEFSGFEMPALFPDYQATFINNPEFSTILAGIVGVIITFAVSISMTKLLKYYNNALA